jgi:hypothetical protein
MQLGSSDIALAWLPDPPLHLKGDFPYLLTLLRSSEVHIPDRDEGQEEGNRMITVTILLDMTFKYI